MAFRGSIEDRLMIRERMGAYADAAMAKDLEAYLANWTEDCVWLSLGQEFHGKEALRIQWPKTWTGIWKMGFFNEIGAIEVDGDRATARCNVREIVFMEDGGVRKLVAWYDDELVRENGEWLFSRRAYNLIGDEPPESPAGVTPSPADNP
jgi:uncharacterized protein (TIGR02246 family)